jgi:hypothetical protein
MSFEDAVAWIAGLVGRTVSLQFSADYAHALGLATSEFAGTLNEQDESGQHHRKFQIVRPDYALGIGVAEDAFESASLNDGPGSARSLSVRQTGVEWTIAPIGSPLPV